MTRPHEETWSAGAHEVDVIMGNSVGLWANNDVLFGEIYTDEGDRTALVVAAPDMAKALRAVLTCQNKGPCRTCEMTMKSALVKAGVPLP